MNHEKNDVLNEIRKNNPNHIKVDPLNIKSIRNKFEILKGVIGNQIDFLLICQTKLNDTFPLSQFILERLLHHLGLIERSMVKPNGFRYGGDNFEIFT